MPPSCAAVLCPNRGFGHQEPSVPEQRVQQGILLQLIITTANTMVVFGREFHALPQRCVRLRHHGAWPTKVGVLGHEGTGPRVLLDVGPQDDSLFRLEFPARLPVVRELVPKSPDRNVNLVNS